MDNFFYIVELTEKRLLKNWKKRQVINLILWIFKKYLKKVLIMILQNLIKDKSEAA